MSDVILDLSAFEPEDLRGLRLGAQVMRHRAGLAVRPWVVAFFVALDLEVDQELARRERACVPCGSITLTFDELVDRSGEGREDRRLLAEYLDVLGGNPRLSMAVRQACASMGDQLTAVQ